MIPKNFTAGAVLAVVVSLALAASEPPPPALSAAAAKAELNGPFLAWCSGEFRPGKPNAFAVALSPAQSAARYVILERDGTSFELSSFTGRADLSCYSAVAAKRLADAITASETIHGKVNPSWSTAVVCGFVEETRAVCWQFSPADGRFVKVGEWIT
jgi:hypothetical protein